MIKGVSHAHLGPIWYHSEPSDVPYSPNQFLGWDIFAVSYNKPALERVIVGIRFLAFDLKRLSNGGMTFEYSGHSGLCMTLANISKE